jgi:glycosyltransferase involved in cell wall biosynthesis
MRIAFYAPLKPPDHPIPSGDRQFALLFLAALRLAGHDAFVASRFRSFERNGGSPRQPRLASAGALLARRFLRRCDRAPETTPELWFTYHLYHKAPDWLGPEIADALGIPYVVAEASDAPKQALGGWGAGREGAKRAIQRADAVIGMNPADRECVIPLLRDPWRWIAIKPFLDMAAFRQKARPNLGPPRLIAVAMMRYGDKLASYRILGDALSRLLDLFWSLEVVGDGPARSEVQRALDAVRDRVIWAGALSSDEIRDRLASADLFVWPAFNEALGMALLEAQASGLPVVAGRSGGVGEVVVSGMTGLLVRADDSLAFADAVRGLILDSGRRTSYGEAAQQRALMEHDISTAACRLAAVIDTVRLAHPTR